MRLILMRKEITVYQSPKYYLKILMSVEERCSNLFVKMELQNYCRLLIQNKTIIQIKLYKSHLEKLQISVMIYIYIYKENLLE